MSVFCLEATIPAATGRLVSWQGGIPRSYDHSLTQLKFKPERMSQFDLNQVPFSTVAPGPRHLQGSAAAEPFTA